MNDAEQWFVVRQENGQCAVLPTSQIDPKQEGDSTSREQWGPYASQQEAIARRVGLIRAGKCQPV
ncbi:hypothetical protein K9N68_02990 [Kovacikia minuta CCNUW1]|uniref:hypothetical protein n=1 Tax=Kovacikia minuta TaxID=2931930 RepID=UPI001CCE7F29|nr:hypothetical protein [Kovacikia minuta]UBF26967.1 hypothetical protein K9N68_02990 [Kovacikia minuta CCNUW1]